MMKLITIREKGWEEEGKMATNEYIWFWRSWLPERKGAPCRVLARGRANSILVEFADGHKLITSRFAVRRSNAAYRKWVKTMAKKEVRKMRSRRSIRIGKKRVKPYRVYYAKSPRFLSNPSLRRSNLGDTHVWLMDLEAENLEDVFQKMQGEVWSPNGEARELILGKGLCHTSMSVGDVVYDVEGDKYFEVGMIGFREIT